MWERGFLCGLQNDEVKRTEKNCKRERSGGRRRGRELKRIGNINREKREEKVHSIRKPKKYMNTETTLNVRYFIPQ